MTRREILILVASPLISIAAVLLVLLASPARAQEVVVFAHEIVLTDYDGKQRMVLSGPSGQIMISGSDGTYRVRLAVEQTQSGEFGVVEVVGPGENTQGP